MADDGGVARYRFGPLERRGLIAGWRGGQIAAVAVGLLVAVGVVRSRPSVAGAALALVAVAVGAAVAAWPIAGRTAEEWAPDAVRFVAGESRRRRAVRRDDPFASLRLLSVTLDTGEAPNRTAVAARRAPRAVGGPGRQIGVLCDEAAQTYTVVLAAEGPGFVLLGDGDKQRRVAAWSGTLAALAREGTVVHRLQWVQRSLPDGGTELHHHVAHHRAVPADSPAARSYDELLHATAPVTHRHEVLVAVTIHARRSHRAVRAAGGGHTGAVAVLVREVAAMRRRLADGDVDAGPVLDADALADCIRRGFDVDPFGSPRRRTSQTLDRDRASGRRRTSAPRWPWPMATDATWGRLRADGTWHATYWVAEWPRLDVGADFLSPLLLLSDVRRSTSVVMEPVPPTQAARQVEQARTADVADAELRRRGGFLATARRRREEEVLARREVELADGHAQYRFAGYVTVTCDGPDSLDEACGRVEQAAGQAGLELRRCYGDQRRAFASTLPLGRGLP